MRRTSAHAQVDEDADLVVRAAHLLKQETGTPLGADISVDKRIPLGAGLGGGSSDAASTLLGAEQSLEPGSWQRRSGRAGIAPGRGCAGVRARFGLMGGRCGVSDSSPWSWKRPGTW